MLRELGCSLIAYWVLSSLGAAQTVWHVDAAAAPGGNGITWGAAFHSLDQAIQISVDGDEIWVAAGVYKPRVRTDAADPRSVSFQPPGGVNLYGGFDGTELTLSARVELFRGTILDADIGVLGRRTDNAYHVLRLEGNGAYHTVDGFQLRNGHASGDGIAGRGGAIYSMLGIKQIRNCTFINNHAEKGGALNSSSGVVYLSRSIFEGNSSTRSGGAMRVAFDLYASNCIFVSNLAGLSGGAVFLSQSLEYLDGTPRPTFQNCLFYGNKARKSGGAVFLSTGGVTNTPGQVNLSGCTIFGNEAQEAGGGVGTPPGFTQMADARLRNSIVWGNSAAQEPQLGGEFTHYSVDYSDIEGGWYGNGNIDQAPLFQDPRLGRFTLRAASPCIDAGDNSRVTLDLHDLDADGSLLEPTPLDLGSYPRFTNDPATVDTGAGAAPITDIGCMEFPF
jgi:hypothetical protein